MITVTAKQFLAPGEALAGENEAVVGQNNTTVNKYFKAAGSAYCGFLLWYCDKQSGAGVFTGCANPAYVPTFKDFCRKHFPIVSGGEAREGDLAAYSDQHVFAIKKRLSGSTVITFEGNTTVYKTIAEAEKSAAGTGAYEGIGYKKRVLTAAYTVYRPPYAASDGDREPPPAPAPEPVKTREDYVKDWQRWLGVDPDGQPGDKTMEANFARMFAALVKAHPARQGDKGDYVQCIQGMLYAAGYDPGGLDGDFGPGMRKAVEAFQGAKSLNVDGAAGADTVAALIAEAGK